MKQKVVVRSVLVVVCIIYGVCAASSVKSKPRKEMNTTRPTKPICQLQHLRNDFCLTTTNKIYPNKKANDQHNVLCHLKNLKNVLCHSKTNANVPVQTRHYNNTVLCVLETFRNKICPFTTNKTPLTSHKQGNDVTCQLEVLRNFLCLHTPTTTPFLKQRQRSNVMCQLELVHKVLCPSARHVDLVTKREDKSTACTTEHFTNSLCSVTKNRTRSSIFRRGVNVLCRHSYLASIFCPSTPSPHNPSTLKPNMTNVKEETTGEPSSKVPFISPRPLTMNTSTDVLKILTEITTKEPSSKSSTSPRPLGPTTTDDLKSVPVSSVTDFPTMSTKSGIIMTSSGHRSQIARLHVWGNDDQQYILMKHGPLPDGFHLKHDVSVPIQSSRVVCAAHCLRSSACMAFTHSRTLGLCQLFDMDMIFQEQLTFDVGWKMYQA